MTGGKLSRVVGKLARLALTDFVHGVPASPLTAATGAKATQRLRFPGTNEVVAEHAHATWSRVCDAADSSRAAFARFSQTPGVSVSECVTVTVSVSV